MRACVLVSEVGPGDPDGIECSGCSSLVYHLARKVYRKWELRNDLAWIVNTNKYFQACVLYRTPVRAFRFVEARGTCVSGMTPIC